MGAAVLCTLGVYFSRRGAAFALALLAGAAQAEPLAVVGTGDGLDILRVVADVFRAQNPTIDLRVPDSIGSGGAIAAVGTERERLGRVARPLTAGEAASGIAYQPIIRIPTVFYVHPDVPVRSLTVDQLRRIFTGEVASWRDLGGPDVRVRVVRREDADSSVQVFRATFAGFHDLKFTERSKLALTTQEAVGAVLDNAGAIGFGPYSANLARQLGVIAVDGIEPTDPRYPANVVLALIYKTPRLDADMARFAGFFKTEDARAIVTAFGARLAE